MKLKSLKQSLLCVLGCAVLCGVTVDARAAEPTGAQPTNTDVTRLACVGDSITFGAGVSDRTTKTYPVLLQQWLGAKWEVGNFGASGSTLLKKGNLPYWQRPHFKKALAFKPDVAVILFGANDSKHGSPDNPKIADNWQYKADFADDYGALLAEFRKANPKVKFYLGLPAPSFAPNRYGIDGGVIEKEIVPLVRELAAKSDAKIIDFHTPLNDPKLFHDRVHPNDAGTRVMATEVYRVLTGQEPPAEVAPTTVAAPANTTVPVTNLAPAASVPAAVQNTLATTTVPVVTPTVKENFHIYLLMGQSNMVGRDTRGMDAQTPNPHVLSLNGEGQWVVAKDPLHGLDGRIAPGVGPGLTFALEMLKVDPNVTIGLVPCAVGGTSLGRWVKGADLYEKAVSRAKIAAQAGVLKGVLWHQGEADTTYQKKAEVYATRATAMFKDLRSDLGVPNLPIVVGQIGEFLTVEKYPYVEALRASIERIPTLALNIGKASSAGLGDKGDKLHFSTESERELGVRFAHAMQQLQAATP